MLTGAYGESNVTSQHQKNHYGTGTSISTLKNLADTVFQRTRYKLRYNDMSLVNGGPFDIWNNWDTPHQNHRNGVSTDVSDRILDAHDKLVVVDSLQIDNWVSIVARKYSIQREAGHFHVTIR